MVYTDVVLQKLSKITLAMAMAQQQNPIGLIDCLTQSPQILVVQRCPLPSHIAVVPMT